MPITQIEQMPMVRVFFEKRDRARYTSHLDIMRMMTRALRRSGLPLWYTQGFNPHLYMTFALPIALGYESLCESVDLRMTEDMPYNAVVERIGAVLPPGFRATAAAEPVLEPKEIAWADYDITLQAPDGEAERMLSVLREFLARPEILVVKKTKKGEKEIDIGPLTKLLDAKAEGGRLLLSLRCAAGISLNIAPTLLLNAFYSACPAQPDSARILRTAILTADLKNFH